MQPHIKQKVSLRKILPFFHRIEHPKEFSQTALFSVNIYTGTVSAEQRTSLLETFH